MMKLCYGLPVVLLATVVVIVQHQVAVAQTPVEVNAIAKQITVRIDGANTGTGVIINRQGNTYTVLTNEHVVRLKGNYTIQTPDGRRYNFNRSIVKYFPGVDLAELQFNSIENYRIPELGNSQQVSEGTTIYVAGWSDPDAVSPERSYTFLPGGISRIVRNAKNGYAWVHTNPTKPGMSGGPVLDMLGRLVGINGLSLTNPGTGATDYFGIPINTYLRLAASPPATTSPPRNTNNTPTIFNTEVEKLVNIGIQRGRNNILRSLEEERKLIQNTNNTPTNFALANTFIADSTREEGVESIVISPDGRTLASISRGGKSIKIWNLATGQLIRTLRGHSGWVRSVAISPDGRTLASGNNDNTIEIWNLATGQLIRSLQGHSSVVFSVAFSPDGRILASGSHDNINIWNLATGQLIRTLQGYSNSSYSVAFSPDGRTLASGYDRTINIWNLATGRLIHALQGHSNSVYFVAISPDGKILASCGPDTYVKIWNLATGQLIHTLQNNFQNISRSVLSIAISPDSKTLVSGSSDNTIKIWNLATGQLIRTLQGHSNSVNSVVISADGKTLVSGSSDNTIKIWRVSER